MTSDVLQLYKASEIILPQLVIGTCPSLTTPVPEFNFNQVNSEFNTHDISQTLLQFMNDNKGIGLAANQLGYPYRVFAMRGYPDNFVCFNPKIVYYSEECVLMEEGCLSFPNLIVKIKRPKDIRVRFQTPSGSVVTKQFEGLTARTFQHEMDHLDGILFYNRANKYHKDKALKDYKHGRR